MKTMNKAKQLVKDFMKDESSSGYVSKKPVIGLAIVGLVLTGFAVQSQGEKVLKEEKEVLEEEAVHVINVPHAGLLEVVYDNEPYKVIMPIEGWNDRMSEFAEGLMEGGSITLENFWIDEEQRKIYPHDVYVDGEDAVELIERLHPSLSSTN